MEINMDEWQRLSIYSESRLEDLHNQSKEAHLTGHKPFSWGRFIALSTALLLGMLVWWIR
jgi:hypothetical protein